MFAIWFCPKRTRMEFFVSFCIEEENFCCQTFDRRVLFHLIKRLSFVSRKNFLSSLASTLKLSSEGVKEYNYIKTNDLL